MRIPLFSLIYGLQGENKCASLPFFAVHPYLLAVLLHDLFDDGKPQSPALLVAPAGLHLVETVPYAHDLIGTDPPALILYLDVGLAPVYPGLDDEAPVLIVELNGVIDEVDDDLLDAAQDQFDTADSALDNAQDEYDALLSSEEYDDVLR